MQMAETTSKKPKFETMRHVAIGLVQAFSLVFLSFSSMAFAGQVEGVGTVSSKARGFGLVVSDYFYGTGHLTQNQIAQAHARGMDSGLEARSPFRWNLGLSSLSHKIDNSTIDSGYTEGQTRTALLGFDADVNDHWSIGLKMAADKNKPAKSKTGGIDLSVTYLLGLGPENEPDEDDVVDSQALMYPFIALSFNLSAFQHTRLKPNEDNKIVLQEGLGGNAKLFFSEHYALRASYLRYSYLREEPSNAFDLGETKNLVSIRTGPQAYTAFAKTFPFDHLTVSGQYLYRTLWEAELGFSRTRYRIDLLDTVYSPFLGVFRTIANNRFRIGSVIDLFVGGYTAVTGTLHLSYFW